MEGILGENYLGEDGELKSNVKVGDILTVFSEKEVGTDEIDISSTEKTQEEKPLVDPEAY